MKYIRRIFNFVLILMCFFLFTSCQKNQSTVYESDVLRIVSLSPSNTEILVGLGLADNIVAVDRYSSDIEFIDDDVQIFNGDPNVEKLIDLSPDYIILSGELTDASKYKELSDLGINILNIKTPTTIQGIYDSIYLIGNELGKKQEANQLVDNIKKDVDNLSIYKKNVLARPRVYFEISQAPYLYSFGDNTFLNEVIDLSGGENIFGNLEGWISPSEESIINLNPQIIFTNVDVQDNIEEIKNRHGWENIDAVKNNRVYYIDKNASSRPSQFFVDALEQMNKFVRDFNNENK